MQRRLEGITVVGLGRQLGVGRQYRQHDALPRECVSCEICIGGSSLSGFGGDHL